MAVLHNEVKNLRLVVELVDREVLPVIPGQPAPPPETARLLGTAGMEFLDRRDHAFWPFIRLPVLYLGGQDAGALVEDIRKLCSLRTDRFLFRTGTLGELVLHLTRQEGGGVLVEVGIDLAPYLFETSGLQGEPGRELALFRFSVGISELVTFADQVQREADALPARSRT